MIGHLLIEGSSTAAGAGDEALRMGYTGRLFYHYMEYNRAVQPGAGGRQNKDMQPGPSYVYIHPNVGIDNVPQCFAPHVAQHAAEARGIVPTRKDRRIVGMFAIGGYLDYWVKQQGRAVALDGWNASLETLRDACEKESIRPLLFRAPRYEPGIKLYKGTSPNEALYRDQQAITEQLITDWGAPCVRFEDIVGTDRTAYMAPDGLHPNARGYDRIAEYFVPLIDKELGIMADRSGVYETIGKYAMS